MAARLLNRLGSLGLGIAVAGGVVNTALYNVDGGQRAVIFDRFAGVKEAVVGEGTHFLIPWVQKPIIFDIRSRPRSVPTITGSKEGINIMAKYIESVRKVMDTKCPWVLFSHGTFVVIDKPQEGKSQTLEEQALEALEEFGEVMAACPAGDFNVITKEAVYVVTGHCPYMYTCVFPDEVEAQDDMMVGLYGRSKRQQDFEDQEVVHVEASRE